MKTYKAFTNTEWDNMYAFHIRDRGDPCARCKISPMDRAACCGCAEKITYSKERDKLTDDEEELLNDYRYLEELQKVIDDGRKQLFNQMKAIKEKYGGQAHWFNQAVHSVGISNFGDVQLTRETFN